MFTLFDLSGGGRQERPLVTVRPSGRWSEWILLMWGVFFYLCGSLECEQAGGSTSIAKRDERKMCFLKTREKKPTYLEVGVLGLGCCVVLQPPGGHRSAAARVAATCCCISRKVHTGMCCSDAGACWEFSKLVFDS